MCEYFATIGLSFSEKFITNLISNFKIYITASLQSLLLLDIVENEVAFAIDNIKTNSAPGSNGISSKFIEMAKVVLVLVLTNLYNKCLKEESFSNDFKSHDIPIPKTAAPKELCDFRLISLLNVFSKIFSKILKEKMVNFINKNNQLTSEQFGFTRNSFTEQAITTIYHNFLDNLDNKQYTCTIFLDIKKTLIL